ncbi:unnamed protein product [Pleuronectes platessa]|uniref:Uncharacterized protein n=1 Tax=Pleuronectes platessa TaxID=8262 RepID=A0A9N7W456_PLEPL|nr:unnamed protein product [Pleuronectes platessa]
MESESWSAAVLQAPLGHNLLPVSLTWSKPAHRHIGTELSFNHSPPLFFPFHSDHQKPIPKLPTKSYLKYFCLKSPLHQKKYFPVKPPALPPGRCAAWQWGPIGTSS